MTSAQYDGTVYDLVNSRRNQPPLIAEATAEMLHFLAGAAAFTGCSIANGEDGETCSPQQAWGTIPVPNLLCSVPLCPGLLAALG